MKKLLTFLCISLALIITGCSKTKQDPFAEYRGESSSSLFYKGEHAMAKGSYDDSVKYFEALDGLYPFGPHAQQGQLDIIYAYYMSGDDASAITAADRYTRLYPRDNNVDYAYYMKGVISFDLGLTWLQKKVGINPGSRDISSLEQAFSSFATVAEQFPHGKYAADSLVRMSYVRNLLAEREISIAKFYMERKAYVAAANRASNVVQHFQGTPSVKDALQLMVTCYRNLNLPKMEEQTMALLQANYPSAIKAQYLPKHNKLAQNSKSKSKQKS